MEEIKNEYPTPKSEADQLRILNENTNQLTSEIWKKSFRIFWENQIKFYEQTGDLFKELIDEFNLQFCTEFLFFLEIIVTIYGTTGL